MYRLEENVVMFTLLMVLDPTQLHITLNYVYPMTDIISETFLFNGLLHSLLCGVWLFPRSHLFLQTVMYIYYLKHHYECTVYKFSVPLVVWLFT